MPGQLFGLTAVGGNHENVPVAVAFARERNPFAVGRILRVSVRLDVRRQGHGAAALGRGHPNISAINEGKLFAVRTQGGHAGAGDWLLSWGRELGQGAGTERQRNSNERLPE